MRQIQQEAQQKYPGGLLNSSKEQINDQLVISVINLYIRCVARAEDDFHMPKNYKGDMRNPMTRAEYILGGKFLASPFHAKLNLIS
jgi:hypothetical protein